MTAFAEQDTETHANLVNGTYRLLGELRDAIRPDLHLAQSVASGELTLLALPATGGRGSSEDEIRHEGSVFGEVISPHVHTVVDWNADEPFIAWEYVAAWPLSAAMRTSYQPDIAGVLNMMLSVAHGLAAIHARGALYRGLHPGRILVLRDGSARLATTPHAVLTARGRVVEAGPPDDTAVNYLAPEQIEGVIDIRSDIYSLAAVAYELLTGTKLYADLDPVSMAVQILKKDPVPPSSLRADIPAGVDDLFAQCLARDPDSRPTNMTVLLAQLGKLLEGVASPDTDPLALALAVHPVVFPLLAEDADEGKIYDAIANQVATRESEREAEAETVSPSRRRPRGTTGDKTDVIDDLREARLVTTSGHVYPLEGRRVVIGRHDQNGFQPEVDLETLDEHKVVSREHAVLDFAEGGWYVSDLKGRNGTWLNGERVRKGAFLRLRPGDTLKIANIMLYYRVEEIVAPMAMAEL